MGGLVTETEQQIAGAAEAPETLQEVLSNAIVKITANSGAFFKNKEADAALPFYALAKLCDAVEPEQRGALLVQMAQIACAETDKPQARLKV